MRAQTAVVLGATGLIGELLVQELLASAAWTSVRVLVRKPLPLQHPKLEVIVTRFDEFDTYRQHLGTGDCIFCCIGTTNAKVKGNQTQYRLVDFDIPVNAARFGKEAGFTQFLLVSAAGANSQSRLFYSRLKGEVESVIASFGFGSFHVFRPGLLLGKRTEWRPGEALARLLSPLYNPLLPAKYKSIPAHTVAKAMVAAAQAPAAGLQVYHYPQMIQLCNKL